MAKSQKSGSQPPKKQTKSSGSFQDIWTGPFKESPAYKKVMADKAKADSSVAAYAKKAASQKASAIAKAKKKP